MDLSTIPWYFDIGIEMTFVPKVYPAAVAKNDWHPMFTDSVHKLSKQLTQDKNRNLVTKVDNDPGCVEVPTKILRSWAQAESTWSRVTESAKAVGLTAFHAKHEGGMGHIHAGMDKVQAAIIMMDLIKRPYLAWTLDSPNGIRFCKSYEDANIYIPEFHAITGKAESIQTVFLLPGLKQYTAVWRNEYETLEFRALDAAADWETQEEHIAFLQRYYIWALSQPIDWSIFDQQRLQTNRYLPAGYYPTEPRKRNQKAKHIGGVVNYRTAYTYTREYRHDLKACEQEFRNLIEELELPWDRYSWYIERNLRPAFKFGTRQ